MHHCCRLVTQDPPHTQDLSYCVVCRCPCTSCESLVEDFVAPSCVVYGPSFTKLLCLYPAELAQHSVMLRSPCTLHACRS